VSNAATGSSGECPRADSTLEERFFFWISSTNLSLTRNLVSVSYTSTSLPGRATNEKLERSGLYLSTSTVTAGFFLKGLHGDGSPH